MYFKITKEFLDLIESGDNSALKSLDFLELSIKLGKHFVFGEIGILERIISLDRDIPFLKSLQSVYSEIGSISETFDWHVEFCNADTPSWKDDNKKIIYISISAIPAFEIHQECHLLCENLNDIKLFEHILSWYQHKHNYSGIGYNFYPLLGGGLTTAEVLKNEATRKKNFILCICDSDFKYRNEINKENGLYSSALGCTARAVKEVYNKANYYGSLFYHYQNISELENLIPFSILYECIRTRIPDKISIIKQIKKIYDADKNLLSFFDFKKGVSLKRLENLHEKDNLLDIVRIIDPDIDNTFKIQEKATEELQSVIKESIDRIEIEDEANHEILMRSISEVLKERKSKIRFVEGLGDKIMDHVLEFINDDHEKGFIDSVLSSDQDKEFETIGSLLHSWTSAYNPVALGGA